MNICSTHLKLKKCKTMWLWKHFENWMQLTTFHQKLQNWEFGWLWKRSGRHIFVEEKGMTICCIMSRCFRNVFERRESKCCAVLIKHRRKVKGEQVITLQMTQQLKTKNINVVPGQLFCCQCKPKFLLETDSLYWWWR